MVLLWHRGDFIPFLPRWHLCGLFCLGSGPGLLLLCCFLARRNANLAGGFAGRPVWVLFLLSIATVVFDVQLEPKMCSNFTFMLFRPISGPSL